MVVSGLCLPVGFLMPVVFLLLLVFRSSIVVLFLDLLLTRVGRNLVLIFERLLRLPLWVWFQLSANSRGGPMIVFPRCRMLFLCEIADGEDPNLILLVSFLVGVCCSVVLPW